MPVKPVGLPRVVGHRGAASYAPENTLASMREARRRGATWVEFDVKLSADGVLILMHDDTLARTAGVDRAAADMSWADIQKQDAGSWFSGGFARERVPSFEATIECLAELGLGANIEIKPSPGQEVDTAVAVIEMLDRAWPPSLPVPLLSSFKDRSLAAAAQRNAAWPRALLLDRIEPDWQERARAVDAVGINTNGRRLQPEQAKAIKDAGFLLGVYTINEAAKARELISWGADCIITDAPDIILAALP